MSTFKTFISIISISFMFCLQWLFVIFPTLQWLFLFFSFASFQTTHERWLNFFSCGYGRWRIVVLWVTQHIQSDQLKTGLFSSVIGNIVINWTEKRRSTNLALQTSSEFVIKNTATNSFLICISYKKADLAEDQFTYLVEVYKKQYTFWFNTTSSSSSLKSDTEEECNGNEDTTNM